MSSNSFEVKDAPGKGMGVFAIRDIVIGELVIAEAPLFTASSPGGINASVARLSPADLAKVLALSDIWSPTAPHPVTIFKTNALPLGVDSLTGGLFPTISRINHSCSPNVHHSWNDNLGSPGKETIYAVAAIKAGEEILTSYVHPAASRSDRLALLRQKFNFDCRCVLCAAHTNAASDIRRVKIAQLDDEIMMKGQMSPLLAYKMAKERLRLMDQEGLADHSEKSRTHYDAFQMCVVSSDFKVAKRHAGMSYGGRVLCEGPHSDATAQDLACFQKPRSHRAAGMGRDRKMPMVCDTCGLVAKVVCEGCACAVYCDADCKKENAKWHDAVCAVIQEVGKA